MPRMPGPDSHPKPSLGVDPEAFRKRGYTVVRQVLDAQEVQQLRSLAEEAIAQGEHEGRASPSFGKEGTIRNGAGDLLGNPQVRHILLDPRILGIVRELLGGDLVYFGDSNFRIGKNGERGWHRDNVDRRRYWHLYGVDGRRWGSGPDWDGVYPILRCALYLQDQSRYSGGLALRPGSNRPGLLRPTLPKLVDARPGDLVAWELKTVHSAEVARLRWLPGLPLHPRVQSWLPQSMRVPEETARTVLFMTFARAGAHLDRYLDYLKSRDYMQAHWANSRFGSEALEEAESRGLRVIKPVPTYGPSVAAAT
jgi:hypothetical protein